MSLALYGTIWIALILFCIGEPGRRDLDAGRVPAPLTWWAYAIGAVILIAHMVIAMGVAHNWSHQSSVDATARQTYAVYGLNWGGGVFMNYVFAALWLIEAIRWQIRSATPTPRRAAIVWSIRIFYLVMILNAAVIFTPAPRRYAGAAMVLYLLWIWRRTAR